MLAYIIALPRSIVVTLLNCYRKIVSPSYGNVCRYFPSCSAYTTEAIIVHGLVKGSYLGGKRILSCNPWGGMGVDHVPARKDGKATAGPIYSLCNPNEGILELNHPKIIED
ncbi:MAG: membrane protein insertion efficiency factor YidD [Micrococcaceae bacterium]